MQKQQNQSLKNLIIGENKMKITSIEFNSNIQCPKCGSSQVSFGVNHSGPGLQAECRNCGHCWS